MLFNFNIFAWGLCQNCR